MKNFFAELVGTSALVFAGCGAIVSNNLYGGTLGHVGISITFGLVIMVMIYAFGNISGAHYNPAVTIAFFAAGRIKIKEVLYYIPAQIIGSVLGALALFLIFPQAESLGITMPSGSIWQAFGLEVLLTFILMTVILNVSTGHMEKGIMAGAAIGATVVLCALFGGPVSGASMNPARSLAPAIMSGEISHIWIYLTAPIVGALCAIPTCKLIQGKECKACSPVEDME